MSIDKSWIHLRNRLSDEYLAGVQAFIDIAKNYTNDEGLVRCPCKKCNNGLWQRISVIEAHIIDIGFTPLYTNWFYHGEADLLMQRVVDVEDDCSGNEMADVLEDVVGRTEVNDEQNAGLDSSHREKYDDLFLEMEKELYPGCKSFHSLNFLVKLMHLKVLNKWTNKSFDMLLKLLKEAFPEGCNLPDSHYAAKKKLAQLGLGYESIHVCKNDCSLFWKEHAQKEQCPICNESRWVDKNTKGKKVPQKVLRYFPLTPRLQRLYGSRHTAKDIRWHNVERSKDGVLRHPADG